MNDCTFLTDAWCPVHDGVHVLHRSLMGLMGQPRDPELVRLVWAYSCGCTEEDACCSMHRDSPRDDAVTDRIGRAAVMAFLTDALREAVSR